MESNGQEKHDVNRISFALKEPQQVIALNMRQRFFIQFPLRYIF